MLIVIEGGDAVGKATQARRLHNRIVEMFPNGRNAIYNFPDYSTITGKAVLELLKEQWKPVYNDDHWTEESGSGDGAKLRALMIQTLMTMNRYEKHSELSLFGKSGHDHAVVDRYIASGLVYGESDGLDFNHLVAIHSALPQPDLCILIDLPAEEGYKRRPNRRDEYEKRSGFMEIVRTNYLKLFNDRCGIFNGTWKIVDGTKSEDAVHADMCNIVNEYMYNNTAQGA